MKTLRNKCLTALQLMKRLETANDEGYCECRSCGKWQQWNEMDGGHFVPKGKGGQNSWALVEENVWPQCKGCNGFQAKYGKANQLYTCWMIDHFGRDFVDEMLQTNPVRKYSKADLEEMLFDFNEHIRFHKKRLGV